MPEPRPEDITLPPTQQIEIPIDHQLRLAAGIRETSDLHTLSRVSRIEREVSRRG